MTIYQREMDAERSGMRLLRLPVAIAGVLFIANVIAEVTPEKDRIANYSDLAELIMNKRGDVGGAQQFVAHREPVVLSVDEAAGMVGERNLAVRIRDEQKQGASARITQSAAAFDTVFRYTTDFFRPDTYDRDAVTTRLRERVVDFAQFEADFAALAAGQPNVDAIDVCVIVDGQLVNGDTCTTNTEFSSIKENASFDTGPFWTIKGGIGVLREFRWGGAAGIDYASTYTHKTFHNLGNLLQPLDPNDPLDKGSRFGWTSNLDLSFRMPLPYSKDFGEFGSRNNVNLKLSDIDHTRAAWDSVATLNDRIAQTQASYWRLVAAALRLHTVAEQRELIEKITKKVEQRYGERLATDYDRIQAQERLQSVLEREEFAWSDYLSASNELVDILDFEGNLLIIPHEYEKRLDVFHNIQASAIMDAALANRAELKSAEQALESARVAREHAARQARPDLSLVMSWSLAQVDTAVGYKRYTGSFANIIDPDRDDFFVGVFYRRPFGNVAQEASRDRAGFLLQQAQFALDQQRIDIANDVNQAVAGALSSEAQVKLTRSNAELAQHAYNRANRLRQQGVVSEFELLSAYQELLNARTAYVDALANYQQSYVVVERAQGLLGEHYNAQ